MTMLEQQMIDVDGATLEVGFAGSGEPIICQSHPFGATTPDYDPGNGWESGMGRLVAVNPRGVGRSSSQEPRDFTFRQHVDDLEEVRRRLGVDRWVFWGGSGGGCIGLLYALLYPQALTGVVIAYMGPNGRQIIGDERSDLSPNCPRHQSDLRMDAVVERHPAVLGSLRPELASAEWLGFSEDRWALVKNNRPVIICPDRTERTQASFEEFATVFDVQDRLGEIQTPTLIVAGGRDETVPLTYSEVLKAGLPHAQLAVFEESGHGIEPASADGVKYRARVRQFLAGIPK